MDILLFGLLAALVAYALSNGDITIPGVSTLVDAVSGQDPYWTAINTYITIPLGLAASATDILYAQASLETGGFNSTAFSVTNSMFNRHVGNGVVGSPNSDGYWTGREYYATASDPDLRIYSDVNQSAQDMAQLLQNALYKTALQDLRNGDAPDYYNDLTKAGYAASLTYAADCQSTYNSLFA